jgi:hypothetical protein
MQLNLRLGRKEVGSGNASKSAGNSGLESGGS